MTDYNVPTGVLTYDLETTTGSAYKRKASPFLDTNYVVAAGFKEDDGPTFGSYYASREASRKQYVLPLEKHHKILVGFNIKFDLLWSWNRTELQDFFRRGGIIWDCQYVEYMLEGHQQHAQYASMDSCVEKYGGTLKIDAVKEMWEQGIDTPDIPEDLLMDYLLGNPEQEIEGDVNNTYLIFKGQYQRAKKLHPNFMGMMVRRMDGLLGTTEMENNGLHIDVAKGEEDRAKLHKRSTELAAKLSQFIPELPEELEFNWNSIYHKSYLIYGGTAKYEQWEQHEDPDSEDGLAWAKKTEKWPLFGDEPVPPEQCSMVSDVSDGGLYRRGDVVQDVFKSGKRKGEGKTRNVTVPDKTRPKGAKQPKKFRFPGFTKPERKWASTLRDADDNPIFSTSSDTLEYLTATRTDVPFLQVLGERTKVQKDLGTYYWDEDETGVRKGMLTLVNERGFIHHKLNHTATVTSRLSSSDPNMQNIPRGDKSEAKAMFTSRFGPAGLMAEVDYSQLEVVIQGILSRDPQLIEDLNNNVDFHCKRLAAKLGIPYDEIIAKKKAEDPDTLQARTDIKAFTFQRAYGAGAYKIALSTGMELEEVENLIATEERLYPGVIRFDNIVEQSIGATAVTTNREIFVAGQRFLAQRGEWISPAGIRYVWQEHETPEGLHKHGKFVGFSPTERKNWPVQGEGGFVVQAMVGYLFRLFNKHSNFDGKALMVNTVHDCVWFDFADRETADKVLPLVKQVLEAVPAMYKRTFNIDIPVRFPTEAELGPNMLDLEHYHYD